MPTDPTTLNSSMLMRQIICPATRTTALESGRMTIGLALVLIFVLYLIDKHNQWRATAKIAAALIALALLSVGGYYGYTRYKEYREKKREYAIKMQHDAAIKTCLARFPSLPNNENAWLPECEENPDRTPCWSKPNDKAFQFDQNDLRDSLHKPIPPAPHQTCYPITAGSTINK